MIFDRPTQRSVVFGSRSNSPLFHRCFKKRYISRSFSCGKPANETLILLIVAKETTWRFERSVSFGVSFGVTFGVQNETKHAVRAVGRETGTLSGTEMGAITYV